MPAFMAVGPEFAVNSTTLLAQKEAAVAADADGDFVVVWQSDGQDGSGYGVYAQRYNAAGVAQGTEFRVNMQTTSSQSVPAVAMDADGDIVVVWHGDGQDGSSVGIYARRYNAQGVAQGGEFRVNTYTTNNQLFPAVAMDIDGDFVVTWASFSQEGTNTGVYAQRFNAVGTPQGPELHVNTYTISDQTRPTVAVDADGDFVIAWQSFDQEGGGSGDGIYAQRFNAAGAAQGTEFHVNTYTTGNQRFASVAMDSDGDFVVAWCSNGQDGSGYGVYAQRYNAAGAAQGGEFQVNTYTSVSQWFPSVALDADGDFLIAWQSYGQDGAAHGVFARRYSAAGTALGAEFQVNTYTTGAQQTASVATDADGDLVVAWESIGQDGSSYGVYAQRYEESVDAAGPTVAGVFAPGNQAIDAGERLVQILPQVVVGFGEDVSTAGGAAGVGSVTNPANWALTRNSIDVSGRITGITYGFNAVTGRYEATLSLSEPLNDGQYVLTAKQAIVDLAGNPLDGNFDGTPGGDFVRSFTVQLSAAAPAEEIAVNKYTTNGQAFPAVATDADGDYVVVWQSNSQDTSLYGVYAQRYTAAGNPLGPEFRVNSFTSSYQGDPAVAMDADGDFVVVWDSYNQDGSAFGIYGQRYNAQGVAQGSEFRVNTFLSGRQIVPTVAMDADGDFVVTWYSQGQDSGTYGVYAQRYNAAGVPQGGEFRVNSYTTSDQITPAVAMDADGDFVITWQSYGQDGSGWGVYARRYNAAGVDQGPDLRVNTFTTGQQRFPTVALDADGDFVVTWQSGQEGSGYGIYAQRFDAQGAAQGLEFRVNSFTTNDQTAPMVALDADGDFVIAWQSRYQEPNGWSVYAQRYNALGVAQGLEFRVNAYTIDHQIQPAVAVDADGDFVVAWSSRYQDGSSYGVYARRYSSAGAPLPAAPADTLVNTFAVSGNQRNPAVAVDADGDTVVAWESYDGNSYGIFAQRYNAAGVAMGPAFQVNTYTTNNQSSPVVALDADGDFVVAWRSYGQDGSGLGIYARRYNAAGTAQGIEFLVNAVTNGTQSAPALALDADGDFVVAWQSYSQDGSGYGVYARRYNATGVAQGTEFPVNTYTTGYQLLPAVGMDADGDFVVAWTSNGQDGSSYGVYAQRYSAAGIAQGSELRINAYTTSYQRSSTLVVDADGDFVVAWQSFGQDGSNYGIYAQRFNAAGAAQGAEFRVNSYTANSQQLPAAALDADGDFVIAWQSSGQDGSGDGIYAQRFFSVNTAPATSGIGNVAVLEDAADTVLDIRSRFGDLEDLDAPASLAIALTGNTNPGLFTTAAYNAVTGQLTLDFAPNANGTAVLTFRATDSGGSYTETSFSVSVTAINDKPSYIIPVPAVVANEDIGPVSLPGWALYNPGTANESFQVATFTITNVSNPGLFAVLPAIASDGTLTFTAAANVSGSTTFAVTVKDGGGTSNGGQDTSTTETFTLTVVAVNDAPTATDDTYTLPEDGGLTRSAAQGVLANDTDVDGPGPLTAALLTGPAHGTLTLNTDGSFTYTPTADFAGTDSFSYRVSDAAGATNFGSVVLTVTPVNDDPTAAGDTASVAEDGGASAINVLANDSSAPDCGETLSISSVTQGGHGAVVITGDGTGLTYQPAANFTGTDSFTYTVSDGNGGLATATVIVAVTSVNDAPTAGDDSVSVAEDSGANPVAVLVNDSTAPDAGETLVITGKTNGAHGTVAITGGGTGLTYTPAANYVGGDSFTYTVSDGNGGTATATVGVTVTASPFNDSPVAQDDTVVVTENSGFSAIDVLANDSDPDLDPRTILLVTPAAHGTATLNNNGTPGNPADDFINYTPAANFFGTDSFVYLLADGRGGLDSATVTVTVTPQHAFFATGTDAGPVGRVRIYHAVTHAVTFSFVPYAGFTGGIRVAVADVTGDTLPDVITAPGAGLAGGALVQVYDGAALANSTATVVASFRPYTAAYTGEVFLTAGRFNGDAVADIVTGNAPTSGPTVKVFDGADLPGGDPVAELASFQPFGARYKGGARVAVGDVNGDGTADVIAGMSKNGSLVKAFSGANVATVLTSINVSPTVVLKGGVFVAAGNVDADANAEILVGLSNKSEVRVYKDASATNTKATQLRKNTAVYPTTFKGGVRVASLDVDNDGDAEVLIAPGKGAERRLRVLDGLSLALLDELFAEDSTFSAGLFVGGGQL